MDVARVVFHTRGSTMESGDILKEALEKTQITHDVKQQDDGGALTSMLLN